MVAIAVDAVKEFIPDVVQPIAANMTERLVGWVLDWPAVTATRRLWGLVGAWIGLILSLFAIHGTVAILRRLLLLQWNFW